MKALSVTFTFLCDNDVFAALTRAPEDKIIVSLPALGIGWYAPNMPDGGYIGPPDHAFLTHRAQDDTQITRTIRIHGKKGLDLPSPPIGSTT